MRHYQWADLGLVHEFEIVLEPTVEREQSAVLELVDVVDPVSVRNQVQECVLVGFGLLDSDHTCSGAASSRQVSVLVACSG